MEKLIYQGKQLKLHKRATCLLELLKTAQARQTLFEKDLALWRRGTYDTPIRLMQKEEDILIKIARMNEIQKRILRSYHWLILDLYEITNEFHLPINLFL
jgi:uncharacterized LabA/DUF88 family protein